MIVFALVFCVAASFGISATVVGLATFHTLRARDIDAGIVGIIVTSGLAIAALCAGSILITL